MKYLILMGIIALFTILPFVQGEITPNDALEVSEALNERCNGTNFTNDQFLTKLVNYVENTSFSDHSLLDVNSMRINLIGCDPNYIIFDKGAFFFSGNYDLLYDSWSPEERFEYYEKVNDVLSNFTASYGLLGLTNKDSYDPGDNFTLQFMMPGAGEVLQGYLSLYYGDFIMIKSPYSRCSHNEAVISSFHDSERGQIHISLPPFIFDRLNQWNVVSPATLGRCVFVDQNYLYNSNSVDALFDPKMEDGSSFIFDYYFHTAYILKEEILTINGIVKDIPGDYEINAIFTYLGTDGIWKTEKLTKTLNVTNTFERHSVFLYVFGLIFAVISVIYPNIPGDKKKLFFPYSLIIMVGALTILLLFIADNLPISLFLAICIVSLGYFVRNYLKKI